MNQTRQLTQLFSRYLSLTLCVILLLLASCATPQQIEIKLLHSDQHCSLLTPGIELITDQATLSKRLKSYRFLARGITPTDQPSVDFTSHQVVLVALGRKPTPGYTLALTEDNVQIDHRRLQLPLTFTSPATGILQAQVITSPCLYLQIPAKDYQQITVPNSDLKWQKK